MKKNKSFQKKVEKLQGNEQEGLLIAHFGASAEILDAKTHDVIRCHLRKNAYPVITGDHVLWQPDPNHQGIVVGHLPRRSLLARCEGNKTKLLAANVDHIFIVTAPAPLLSEHLIDRYLITAEKIKIKPIIIFNKTDLLTEDLYQEVTERLNIYKKIGYEVIYSSIYDPKSLDELQKHFIGKTSVLVGPSGVGKSSLIGHFTDKSLRVGETAMSGLGKHTTTITRLYPLVNGGSLIDSPGVRDFNLGNLLPEEILDGFVEFKPFLNLCKYRNCHHTPDEIECALQKAAQNNEISTHRLESYLNMLEKYK